MTHRQLHLDLPPRARPRREPLAEEACVLRGAALAEEALLLRDLSRVVEAAPPRRMKTPGGQSMSAALTSTGSFGWVTDHRGYRYVPIDPESGQPWPPLPDSFLRLAQSSALEVGFPGFEPDSCLVNRYEPGARMGLHQDKEELDFSAPIVSVSLGLPVVFLFGGMTRKERAARISLEHGDVVVWGGSARLRYHGVMPIEDGEHPKLGRCRINLTFRRAR